MHENSEYYRELFQSSTVAVVTLGPDAVVRHHTPTAGKMLAGPGADLVGELFPSLFMPDAQEAVDSFLRRVAQADRGESAFIEAGCALGDGDERFIEMTSSNLLGSTHVGGIVLNLVDRTELRRALVLADRRARVDELTGLANRTSIEEEFRALFRANPDRPVVVALFDLDSFKGINDRFGHSVGDRVLRSVAHHLSAALEDSGTVARLGGDEFLALLPDVDVVQASGLLDMANRAIRLPVDGTGLHVTASCGAASSSSARGWSDLLKLADVTLYQAKEGNKGGVCFYREGQLGWEQRRKSEHEALLDAERRVAELKSDVVRLARETRSDQRTGLLNDAAFAADHAAQHLLAAHRGETYALVLCDIDFFGKYNTRYLYQPANETLRCVADALKKGCRPEDLVYRYGGEELTILLPRTSLPVARERAEQLRTAVERLAIPHEARPEPHIVTVSVGVAECSPHRGGTTRGVIDAANRALVRAKESGRNRVVIAGDEENNGPPAS